MNKQMVEKLHQLLLEIQRELSTMDGTRESVNRRTRNAQDRICVAIGIVEANCESGPENSREEVSGLGSNKNNGNSGFAGGCTRAKDGGAMVSRMQEDDG